MGEARIKRVYEAPVPGDGQRVLVDRLWPRGLRRDDARLDAWLKEIAPSTGLRTWFGHDPDRWDAFRQHYRCELDANVAAVAELRAFLSRGDVTLLYAARDTQHNHARVLADYMRNA
ncbi:DUF488 domain-containing protein [Sphingomonadaceae bacterium jetA1]|jgi:uncharacterized protein YeaO (DUF488 family)|uniref:DUF488 domain-containing protein n=1 Tax=Facivitalis istanbulensis TaxID=3075838 RepID=UPI003488EA72